MTSTPPKQAAEQWMKEHHHANLLDSGWRTRPIGNGVMGYFCNGVDTWIVAVYVDIEDRWAMNTYRMEGRGVLLTATAD